jgi:hypothetical protein
VAAAIQTLHDAKEEETAAVPPRVFRGNLAGWRPHSFRQRISVNRMAEVAQWEHDTLFPKYHLASGISLVESYGSIKLMDYESLLYVAKQYGPRQDDKSYLPQPTALRLLGTEALVLPEKYRPEFAELVDKGNDQWPENTALWRMTRTLPRAWIAHEVATLPPLPFPLRIEAADERTKSVLFPGDKPRDFSRTAVVETDQPLAKWQPIAEVSATEEQGESCRITHYGPQRVVIEVELSQPGLLVLGDAWYPGWQAYVTSNGAVTQPPIYRTNRILRGIWLPAGQQTVEFRFEPASFTSGATISGVSWLVLAVLGAILLWRRKS